MSATLTIVGAIFVAAIGLGGVLWLSMKLTDRKEAAGGSASASSNSDGAGGYHVPVDPCGSDGGGCD